MLDDVARLEHAYAQRMVRQAVQLIEPAFIIAFGGLVALVASALLQALYGIRPT
jgi:type II secretory pathway component PulF